MLMPTQIADDARPRLARGVRLQVDGTTGHGVLLFPEGILELNDTAHEILTRCDGRTLTDIARSLAEEYDVDLTTIAADVRETLADFQRRKLLDLV
jgi:pyrroloquinoline quinone biosynthesis protein D